MITGLVGGTPLWKIRKIGTKDVLIITNRQYYALQFVRPIASLKSYHVTIQQSPVSDPPTE
jgi:hypothetical protein